MRHFLHTVLIAALFIVTGQAQDGLKSPGAVGGDPDKAAAPAPTPAPLPPPAPPASTKVPELLTLPGLKGYEETDPKASQFKLAGVYYFTDDSDTWELQPGLEFAYRHWFSRHAGLALEVSLDRWEADDSGSGKIRNADGHLARFPVGLSLMLSPNAHRTLAAHIELGARYVFNESSLDGELNVPDAPAGVQTAIEVDDMVTGRAGLHLNWNRGKFAGLSVAAGYIFEIEGGEISASNTATTLETEFDGIFVQAGINF